MLQVGKVVCIAKAMAVYTLISCVLLEKQVSSSASAGSVGTAVVINMQRAPKISLPSVSNLNTNLGSIAQAYRAAGLKVATDPTGRCLAVTDTAHITDSELLTGNLQDGALAAGIVQRVTKKQVTHRNKGFLRLEELSDVQRAAALRIAQRHGLANTQGQPVDAGARLVVGIWPSWIAHIASHKSGVTICRKLDAGFRPPSPVLITVPPLTGSVIWYSWPYSTAEWGEQTVSIDAGTYALGDLLDKLSAAGGLKIRTHSDMVNRRVAVLAVNVPVRALLWTIEVACGVQVWRPSSSAVVMVSDFLQGPKMRSNVLRAQPGLGYFVCGNSEASRELLSSLYEGRDVANWIGWSFSDLPLLYHNIIKEQWPRAYKTWAEEECGRVLDASMRGPAPPLDPSTWVLWTKALSVCVESQHSDGGGGVEILLPVFD